MASKAEYTPLDNGMILIDEQERIAIPGPHLEKRNMNQVEKFKQYLADIAVKNSQEDN